MRWSIVATAAAVAALAAAGTAAAGRNGFPGSRAPTRHTRGAAPTTPTTTTTTTAGATSNGTVYLTANGSWVWAPGVVDTAGGVAWGVYTDAAASPSAFASLSVASSPSYNDSTQGFGAGYVEAALTALVIKPHWDNMQAWLLSNFANGTIPPVYQQFFNTQDAWARAGVAANGSVDPKWAAVGVLLAQFDGLVAGYAAVAPAGAELGVWQFQQMNAMGDFLDLIPALQPHSVDAAPWRWWEHSAEAVMERVRATSHCSSLFKTTGNFSDIFFGHSAWFIYQGTNRIYKHYRLDLHNPALVGTEVSFSSYPGYLESMDDFYQVWTTGIVVTETSNSIFNMSLYDLVVPQSLFAWQRVRMANLVAVNGSTWGDAFAYANSGTYNNAYGVLTLPGWNSGDALPAGMLYLVEQIPGLVVSGDVTSNLLMGYHPMFNVPYWPAIYEASGYSEVVAHFKAAGAAPATIAGLSFQLAPRAQIFRRDQGAVATFTDYLAIMRYNDYKNDPYAAGSPWNAICSRGDLDLHPSPSGCYDTKASAASLWDTKTAYAVNGPTTGANNALPPFAWAAFPRTPHEDLPPVYNFTFAVQTPSWY